VSKRVIYDGILDVLDRYSWFIDAKHTGSLKIDGDKSLPIKEQNK
jgi:hypothetical protein